MQVDVRHAPSFAVARIGLAPHEQVKVESGAMSATSYRVTIEAAMQGGFMSALKRSALGGESFFVTTFTGDPEYQTWVDVAAQLPGDIAVIDVTNDKALFVTSGSWLANESTVSMDTKWGGAKMLWGGEGGFVARFAGQGKVVVSAYGALDEHTLAAGEGFVVDSGHLVAYDDGMQMSVRKASKGVMNTMKSGEGLVVDILGPGRVWTQSRNPSFLVEWLTEVLPFTRS